MLRPLLCSIAILTVAAAAEPPRARPAGELPHDSRLAPLKELDGNFPFTPPTSRETWTTRAEQVRTRIRVASGIWPEPTKTPLNAVVHGRIERDDYTVEKVFFESMPGFFVTGNLYRPKDGAPPGTRRPGVLCPYGHWPNGRFMDATDAEVKKQFALGAEHFENAAHSPLQARCVHLARMGCVVFHYDMIGRGDCNQLTGELVHSFAKQRPEMNSRDGWGLFSPQAEARAQSVFGLQTWNSVRALDFIQSLPDVDPQRIGVTGASGGGTQTMIIAGIDPRVTTAFPAVMVSTAMQGGCTCENASLLRVGTGNIEFAALFAPKPMGMTAADDWTKEMPTKGFPQLQQHWALLGVPDAVKLWPLTQFPHNYNAPSRAGMFEWFNKHLGLNLPAERLVERDFQRLTREEMSVWDAAHPAPAGGAEFEKKLLRWWTDDAQKQLTDSPENFRKIAAPAWQTILDRTPSEVGKIEFELKSKRDAGAHFEMTGLIKNIAHGEELPALFLHPKKWNGRTVVWLDERGKAGLFNGDAIRPEVARLLDSGASVIGVDLLFQGEFLANGQPLTQTPRTKNPREAAAYTFGYNDAVFAERVQDVLSVIEFVRHDQHGARSVALAALDSTGPIAAAARVVAGDALGRSVIDTHGFRFADVADLRDANFLPAAAKYGDLPGLLALGTTPVQLRGEAGEGLEFARKFSAAPNAIDSTTDLNAAFSWLAGE